MGPHDNSTIDIKENENGKKGKTFIISLNPDDATNPTREFIENAHKFSLGVSMCINGHGIFTNRIEVDLRKLRFSCGDEQEPHFIGVLRDVIGKRRLPITVFYTPDSRGVMRPHCVEIYDRQA